MYGAHRSLGHDRVYHLWRKSQSVKPPECLYFQACISIHLEQKLMQSNVDIGEIHQVDIA